MQQHNFLITESISKYSVSLYWGLHRWKFDGEMVATKEPLRHVQIKQLNQGLSNSKLES